MTLMMGCDDGPCERDIFPGNQILDANTCECIIVIVEPCNGKTCVTGEILDANTDDCFDASVCSGVTCPEGQFLGAANC